jgi:hypothetical protein
MFLTLLLVSLVLAAGLAFVVLRFLRPPLRGILNRVIGSDSSEHWFRFALFALYITSVGHGVEAYRLERYIHRLHKDDLLPNLDFESWIYEVYQVIERTLTSLACGVITIFIIALICLVVLRIFEMRRNRVEPAGNPTGNA